MTSQWGQAPHKPQHPNPSRPTPWYKQKRWVIPLGLFVLFALIGRFGNDPAETTITSVQSPAETVTQSATEPPPPAMATSAKAPEPTATKKAVAAKPRPKPTPKPTPKTVSSPKPKVTTKPVSKCDPNYSDACVPIASDVDCAGGSGNGPKYFSGVARVTGTDIYDLDRDNDGYACETG
jgi:hypothetical protein